MAGKHRSESNQSPLSNSDLTFCRLVNSGITEIEAYENSYNSNDSDYAEKQIPLILRRGEIRQELARLAKCSPDELLRDDCQRILASSELRVGDRLKVIQTLDKVLQRLTDNKRGDDVSSSLKAWITERLQGGAGPMSET